MMVRPSVPALVVALLVTAALAAQELPEAAIDALEPELLGADVAPIELAFGAVPDLPPVPFDATTTGSAIVVAALPPVDLPPPALPREQIAGQALPVGGDEVFVSARLGAGTSNSVLGTVQVYRFGSEGPQFRIGYDQTGSDGIAGRDPGQGFFARENTIDLWLEAPTIDALGAEVNARYADLQDGLQGQGPYFSADRRTFDADVGAVWSEDERVRLAGEVEYTDRRRVLSRGDTDEQSPIETWRSFVPSVTGTLSWPRLEVGAAVDAYLGLTGVDGLSPVGGGGARLFADAVPLDGMQVRGEVGTYLRTGVGWTLPLAFELSYAPDERLSASLTSSVRHDPLDVSRLWDRYPVLDATSLASAEQWNRIIAVGGAINAAFLDGAVRTGVDVAARFHTARLEPGAFDTTTGLRSLSATAATELASELRLEFAALEGIESTLAWRAQWLDRRIGEPIHRVVLENLVAIGAVDARIDLDLPIDGDVTVPIFGGSLEYELVQDVELLIGAQDLLASALPNGRTVRGFEPSADDPLVDEGFRLDLSVRVSF